jgi:hypothetical protein
MEEELFNEDPRQGEDWLEEEPVEAEPVYGEPVETITLVESVRVLEPVRSAPPAIVQAAAVAATSFVAGAATAAVLNRRRTRQAIARPRPRSELPAGAVGPTQTFLVHVQQIRRPYR